MRKICNILPVQNGMCRCMIYGPCDEGYYLFLYDKPEDHHCTSDEYHSTLEDAEHAAIKSGASGDWEVISDPVNGAQHDWIQAMRVKLNLNGEKLWGQFEKIEE